MTQWFGQIDLNALDCESQLLSLSLPLQVLELLGVTLDWLQKNVLTPNTQHLTTFRLHQVLYGYEIWTTHHSQKQVCIYM